MGSPTIGQQLITQPRGQMEVLMIRQNYLHYETLQWEVEVIDRVR